MISTVNRGVLKVSRGVRRLMDLRRPTREVFERIYRQKAWGERAASASGTGSTLVQTAPVREGLRRVLAEHQIRSMLDVPCGDFHWMSRVDLSGVEYTGGDIVPELVERAAAEHGGAGRRFRVIDVIGDPLPRVDLVFCRDCLVHLSLRQGLEALRNIRRSGSAYVLLTSFSGVKRNRDIIQGQWRPLDLRLAPFNLPEPLLRIDERGWYEKAAKGMSLWRVADLPL